MLSVPEMTDRLQYQTETMCRQCYMYLRWPTGCSTRLRRCADNAICTWDDPAAVPDWDDVPSAGNFDDSFSSASASEACSFTYFSSPWVDRPQQQQHRTSKPCSQHVSVIRSAITAWQQDNACNGLDIRLQWIQHLQNVTKSVYVAKEINYM